MSSASQGQALHARIVVEHPGFQLDAAIDLPPGSITALIGPNGAGKSTVIDALCGLVPLGAGRIQLGEEVLDDVAGRVHVRAGRRRVAVSFQDSTLFDGLTVLDNVAFGVRAGGRSRRESREVAQALLDELGLGARSGDRPANLSGGQAARVALARALAIEPALVLLDEPFAALDVTATVVLRPWLSDVVRRRGLTVLLVTHDPADVAELADHVIVLEAGRVAWTGRPVALTEAGSTFARAFGWSPGAGGEPRSALRPAPSPDPDDATGASIDQDG